MSPLWKPIAPPSVSADHPVKKIKKNNTIIENDSLCLSDLSIKSNQKSPISLENLIT